MTNKTNRESPTPREIMIARNVVGLTQTQAGKVVYSGLRSWQNWEGGRREMNPAVFELFLLKTRQITLEEIENE